MKLQDKVVVLTGCNGGIGQVLVPALLAEGAKVVATDLHDAVSQPGAPGLRYIRSDLCDEDSVAALMAGAEEAFGGVDILINNAAACFLGPTVEFDYAKFKETLDVNVAGAFLCCKHAIPRMRARGGGVVVNMASIMAYVGQQNACAYNCSKGALMSMTQCLALEHAADNIRVVAVCPGFVSTPMLFMAPEEVQAEKKALHPLGRFAAPEEVAKAVIFLASEDAGFCTGSPFIMDGGMSAV